MPGDRHSLGRQKREKLNNMTKAEEYWRGKIINWICIHSNSLAGTVDENKRFENL